MQLLYVNKKLEYILSLAVLASSILIIFAPTDVVRYACGIFMTVSSIPVFLLIKKRAIPSYNKRMILLLMTVFGVVYLSLYYLAGARFNFVLVLGNNVFLNIVAYALPAATIIVASEFMRFVLLSQSDKLTSVIAYLICLTTDVAMSGGVSGIKSFEDFMSLTALTVFPAVIANLVYNYLSVRYGALPNIAYRLITTLYLYIIPFRPNMPDAILAFVNLITPIIIYVFIDTLYEKRRRYALKKKSTLGMLLSVISVIIAALFVMLVSCQFKYGAIVIATESMTGEINKGDAIIYESYDRGNLEVGEVIVFEKDGVKVVHRIVSREKVAGEMRYYTKGDANNANDPGFIKGSDIRGRVLYKVPYIGYPTIYLRELLSGAFD